MWIRMRDTYSGSAGLFLKDMRYDVPDDLLKLLPKGSYEKTCAPWDDHVDKQAVELTAAQNKANDLQGGAERLAAKAEELKQKADSLVKPVAQKQAEAKKTEQLAKQEIARSEKAAENAKKAPSEQNTELAAKLKRKAWWLARKSERKDAEFQLAHSEFAAVLARGELKRLDAEEAKRQAKAAVKALAKLKAKAETEAKVQETNDAKPETEQSAGTVDGQIDDSDVKHIDDSDVRQIEQPVDGESDKPIAEGQAVPSGQAGQ